MGKFFIVVVTLLVMIIIGAINAKNNKRLVVVIMSLLKEINKTYKLIFKQKSVLTRLTQGGMIIGSEVLACISVIIGTIKYIDAYENNTLDIVVKVIIALISIVVIHFSIGYILFISSKINMFFSNVKDRNIKTNLILSYLIISTYFTVLVLFPDQFRNSYAIGLIGIIISYFLNLKVLLQLIRNPHDIKTDKEEITSFSRVMIASILIVIMIILNLFLAVCFINSSTPGGAFTNNPSNFDLFYYTIITFTTVGYGDISPVTVSAKIFSMIISITSVICITVFLSTILSYKDKFVSSINGN